MDHSDAIKEYLQLAHQYLMMTLFEDNRRGLYDDERDDIEDLAGQTFEDYPDEFFTYYSAHKINSLSYEDYKTIIKWCEECEDVGEHYPKTYTLASEQQELLRYGLWAYGYKYNHTNIIRNFIREHREINKSISNIMYSG